MNGKHIKIVFSEKVEIMRLKNGGERTKIGESRIRSLPVIITGSQTIPLKGQILRG